MRPMETSANLADLEKYLLGCQQNAAPGSKAEKQFADWIRAVSNAMAYIIGRETLDKLEEDDGK